MASQTSRKAFSKFLEFCRRIIDDDEVIKMLEKRYDKASKNYLNSKEFLSLLENTERQINNDPRRKFVYLKEFNTEIKAYVTKSSKLERNANEESEAPPAKRAKLNCSGNDNSAASSHWKPAQHTSVLDSAGCKLNKNEMWKVPLQSEKHYGEESCFFLQNLGLSPIVKLSQDQPDSSVQNNAGSSSSVKMKQHVVKPDLMVNDGDSQDFEAKENPTKASDAQIKKLENLMGQLDREIKRLEEEELDLDALEQENSNYILLDKYKAKFVKVWNIICKLKGRHPATGRPVEKRFRLEGTRYPEISRKIEKFINKYRVFPDYPDIYTIVCYCNKKHGMKMSKKMLHDISKDVFTDVGNRLQQRRLQDFVSNFGSHLTDSYKSNEDPALYDRQLRSKLEANRTQAKSKLDELINKFAMKQCANENSGAGKDDGDDDDDNDDDDEDDDEDGDDDDSDSNDNDAGQGREEYQHPAQLESDSGEELSEDEETDNEEEVQNTDDSKDTGSARTKSVKYKQSLQSIFKSAVCNDLADTLKVEGQDSADGDLDAKQSSPVPGDHQSSENEDSHSGKSQKEPIIRLRRIALHTLTDWGVGSSTEGDQTPNSNDSPTQLDLKIDNIRSLSSVQMDEDTMNQSAGATSPPQKKSQQTDGAELSQDDNLHCHVIDIDHGASVDECDSVNTKSDSGLKMQHALNPTSVTDKCCCLPSVTSVKGPSVANLTDKMSNLSDLGLDVDKGIKNGLFVDSPAEQSSDKENIICLSVRGGNVSRPNVNATPPEIVNTSTSMKLEISGEGLKRTSLAHREMLKKPGHDITGTKNTPLEIEILDDEDSEVDTMSAMQGKGRMPACDKKSGLAKIPRDEDSTLTRKNSDALHDSDCSIVITEVHSEQDKKTSEQVHECKGKGDATVQGPVSDWRGSEENGFSSTDGAQGQKGSSNDLRNVDTLTATVINKKQDNCSNSAEKTTEKVTAVGSSLIVHCSVAEESPSPKQGSAMTRNDSNEVRESSSDKAEVIEPKKDFRPVNDHVSVNAEHVADDDSPDSSDAVLITHIDLKKKPQETKPNKRKAKSVLDTFDLAGICSSVVTKVMHEGSTLPPKISKYQIGPQGHLVRSQQQIGGRSSSMLSNSTAIRHAPLSSSSSTQYHGNALKSSAFHQFRHNQFVPRPRFTSTPAKKNLTHHMLGMGQSKYFGHSTARVSIPDSSSSLLPQRRHHFQNLGVKNEPEVAGTVVKPSSQVSEERRFKRTARKRAQDDEVIVLSDSD